MKKILLFPIKFILTILWIPIYLLWFLSTFISCFLGLIVFSINYRHLRDRGSGIFHYLFFKFPGLYYGTKVFHLIWNNK